MCNTESVILDPEDVSNHTFQVKFPETGVVPKSKSLKISVYGKIFVTFFNNFFQSVRTVFILNKFQNR